ncbi:MAG: AAA family ATPase [Phycisphaerales bacterium]
MDATQRMTNGEHRSGEEHVDHVQSIVAVARRALNGRYRVAVLLAIALALLGGVSGYRMSPPQYSSTGLVRVAPTLPKVIYANEQNQLPPAFASMVASHATLMSRRDFLESVVHGMEPADWVAFGPVDDPRTLAGSLEVSHRRGDEVVSVTATGRNPAQVRDFVNAVIQTHVNQQASLASNSVAGIDAQLRDRAERLEREARQLEDEILSIAGPYGGSEMLEWLYESRREELEEVNARLLALGVSVTGAGLHEISPAPMAAINEGELESVASLQAELGALRTERVRVEAEIALLSRSYGPRYRPLRALHERLTGLDELISEFEWRIDEQSQAMAPVIAGLRAQHETLNAEAGTLGRALQQISNLQDERGRRLDRLSETLTRREELQVESERDQAARVSIAAAGEFPVIASRDRRIPAACAGALAGAALGIGIVVLVGAFDGRCRSTADVTALTPDVPLLGVLPELKPRNTWLQQQAASGIHQIRNVLQIGSGQASIRTYCLTSSGANEGKTSVALALATSFAQSGQRTLIIDADLHGRGATDDLELVDQPGLLDAIGAGDVSGCIHSGPVEGLHAIPAGRRHALTPERLSAAALGDLLGTLRERYDAIIIDTAPLLGGPEAATISALADAVVLTVSRNTDGKLVSAAKLRLRQVGARYVGLVFNRATEDDFQRSSSCDQYIPHRAPSAPSRSVSEAVESLRTTLGSPAVEPKQAQRGAAA